MNAEAELPVSTPEQPSADSLLWLATLIATFPAAPGETLPSPEGPTNVGSLPSPLAWENTISKTAPLHSTTHFDLNAAELTLVTDDFLGTSTGLDDFAAAVPLGTVEQLPMASLIGETGAIGSPSASSTGELEKMIPVPEAQIQAGQPPLLNSHTTATMAANRQSTARVPVENQRSPDLRNDFLELACLEFSESTVIDTSEQWPTTPPGRNDDLEPVDNRTPFPPFVCTDSKVDVIRIAAADRPIPAEGLGPLITHACQTASPGEQRLTLRLDPPELGSLTVTLISKTDGLHITVIAQQEALAAVQAQLSQLRDLMTGSEITISHIHVAAHCDSSSTSNGSRDPANDASRHSQTPVNNTAAAAFPQRLRLRTMQGASESTEILSFLV